MDQAEIRDTTPRQEALDARALRAVLGRFATGVVVVTSMDPANRPIGMTVNSFTAVSLDPPLVLFCVSRASSLHPALATAHVFAVNILGDCQTDVSWRFASPGHDRFQTLQPRFKQTGAPLLPTALATIECIARQRFEAGDHDIIVGEVAALEATPAPAPEPLVFYGGTYRSLDTDPMWWSIVRE